MIIECNISGMKTCAYIKRNLIICFSDQIKIKYLKMGDFFFPKN